MTEAEWWDHADAAELAEAVAGDVGFLIEAALDARGDCVAALPGGRTPLAALKKLAASKLRWKSVAIVPTDDRLVAVDHPASNARMLAEIFLPVGARVVPLTSGALPVAEAGRSADARLQDLHWPLDLVWLGMGLDGHTASIFAGPDLEMALTAPHRAVGVTPEPMPEDAPFPRVTLTARAIAEARAVLVAITGDDKRAVLESALADGAGSRAPIGRLLAETDLAIDIHWCP